MIHPEISRDRQREMLARAARRRHARAARDEELAARGRAPTASRHRGRVVAALLDRLLQREVRT
jgi:hypothetical protein